MGGGAGGGGGGGAGGKGEGGSGSGGGGGGARDGAELLASFSAQVRGYTPLLQRAVATTVEARWAGLPQEERAAILAKHPNNAPRLQAAADAAAAAAAAAGK